MARRFPQHSHREIAAAYRQARALLKTCYQTGELCRAELRAREEAEAQLARDFPGFSRAVYERAVSYRMFISR